MNPTREFYTKQSSITLRQWLHDPAMSREVHTYAYGILQERGRRKVRRRK